MQTHLGAVRARRFLTIGLAAFPTLPSPAATLAVPGAFPTIQDALNAAADGDEILVAPGTYQESIDFLGKRVALRAVADAQSTVIDATGFGVPVVTMVASPSGTTLEGFTLRGGRGSSDGFSLRGGGLFLRNASPTIIGCEITGNGAVGIVPANGFGGGAFVQGGAPAFVHCAFRDNTAGRNGGAIYATTNASIIVSNCTFASNIANEGAAVFTLASNMTLVNSFVTGNGSVIGGAISTNGGSTATISGCTIASNDSLGADNIVSANSQIAFTNTIIWGANVNTIGANNATLTYRACDVIGSGGSASWNPAFGTDLGANLDADPRFVNPLSTVSTTDALIDNFRLFDFSPCIDAGDNALLPPDTFDLDADGDTTEPIPLDIARAARRVDDMGAPDTGAGVAPITDIGALERGTASDSIIHVPGEVPTIQRAVDLALVGDTILLSPGVYREQVRIEGKSVHIESVAGAAQTIFNGAWLCDSFIRVIGAEADRATLTGLGFKNRRLCPSRPFVFSGGAISVSESAIMLDSCVFEGNESVQGGAVSIRRPTRPSIITHCTFIRNSVKNFSTGLTLPAFGGAVFVESGTVDIQSTRFLENSSEDRGGAVYASGDTIRIRDSQFVDNHATRHGGACNFSFSSQNSIIDGALFQNNTANIGGAIEYLSNLTFPTQPLLRITNSRFLTNEAHLGGALYIMDDNIEIDDGLFAANHATISGGAIAMGKSTSVDHLAAKFTNMTFADNSAGSTGGALMLGSLSDVQFQNSVLWSSSGQPANVIDPRGGLSFLRVSHSLIQDSGGSGPGWDATRFGVDGGGNIDANPMFRNTLGPDGIPGTGDENFIPLASSPLIDAGDNAAVPPDTLDLDGDGDTTEPTPFDIRGLPRFVDDTGVPDTGPGVAPIVDIGPFEFQGTSVLADFNGDTFIDGVDLAFILNNWGVCAMGTTCRGDLTGDGVVGAADLAVLLKSWSPAAP